MRAINLITAFMLLGVYSAQAAPVEQQREWFQQARKALNHNKIRKFQSLKARLVGYPLAPYLDIWHARKKLSHGDDSEVAGTLKRYASIPEAGSLHIEWMKYLAKRGKWALLGKRLNDFPKTGARIPDITMVAKWRTGDARGKKAALDAFGKHWQKGGGVSDILLPMQRAWNRQKHPSLSERWARIGALAKHRHWREVKALARPLSHREKAWIKLWRSVQKSPAKVFTLWQKDIPPRLSYMILADSFNRMPRDDAERIWQQFHARRAAARVRVSNSDFSKLRRLLALHAAKQHVLGAADWLAGLPAAYQNSDVRAWQVRMYLLANRWKKVQLALQLMPLKEQQKSRWAYWRARAYEMAGDKKKASMLFTELAAGRGYYSFLSAERLRRPYRLLPEAMEVSPALARRLAERPAIRRAYEWFRLGRLSKANSEWFAALAASSPQMWKAAANMAAKWGWYNRMINAAFKAGEMNALAYRFPMGFERVVKRAARETGLDASQIWSVIRQESAFNHQAVSSAGARGLMQLMPKTAQQVAKRHKMKYRKSRLLQPNVNVRLGAFYLARMKKRFNGNMALATAAYNAGPHRVKSWLKRTPFEWEDTWIEAIPFNETRRYVQQIRAFVIVYNWRQKHHSAALTARRKPASGTDHLILSSSL